MVTIGKGHGARGETEEEASSLAVAADEGAATAVTASKSAAKRPPCGDEEQACLKEAATAEGDRRTPRQYFWRAVLLLLSWVCVFLVGRLIGQSRPSLGGASGSLQPEADAPASYGFVYTAEGMAITDDLISISDKTGGPKAALEKSQELLKSSRHFLDACHPLLHRLGRTLFRRPSGGLVVALRQLVPFDAAAEREAASLISAKELATQLGGAAPRPAPVPAKEVDLLMTCNAAYLHGIIELFLFQAGIAGHLQVAVKFVTAKICSRMGREFRPPWECRHGVGHGIAQFHRHNATRRALDEALSTASSSVTTSSGHAWNGIWMDHFASTTVSGHDADDPVAVLSVCSDPKLGARRGRGDCLLYSATAFLLHRPRAYVAALEWCYDGCAPMGSSCESSCVHGVGMQTFKENLDNMRLVGRVCGKAKTQGLRQGCVSGAKGYYSFATGHTLPAQFCRQIEDSTLSQACMRGR